MANHEGVWRMAGTLDRQCIYMFLMAGKCFNNYKYVCVHVLSISKKTISCKYASMHVCVVLFVLRHVVVCHVWLLMHVSMYLGTYVYT